ncbi:hypothetical protein ACIBP6_14950 [Nonomuraea terrae]
MISGYGVVFAQNMPSPLLAALPPIAVFLFFPWQIFPPPPRSAAGYR